NLSEPLAEIRRTLEQLRLPDVAIRTLVRTGDTPGAERQAMVKRPPHILVTTPESLYLLLTAERSRAMLRTARTVIVDEIHDVALEIPSSPLEAVMAAEVWEELYNRLAQLIGEHRTTLVFVNTRRLAERLTLHLSERIGAEHITSHHGSLSKEKRLDAEQRLK